MNDPYSELIKVAAELAQGIGFPSPYEEDWNFQKTTGPKDRRKIILAMEQTERTCADMAMRIKRAADALRATHQPTVSESPSPTPAKP